MQILTYHFSRKKSDFLSFFSSITQLIQKLSYDIQIQIDKQFIEASQQFKGLHPQEIEDACMKMQNDRVEIYDKMIDRLFVSFKNYAFQLNQNPKQRSSFSPKKQSQHNINPESKVTQFNAQSIESQKVISPNTVKKYDSSESSQSSIRQKEEQTVQTPVQQNRQEYYLSVRMPSPFAERYKKKSQQSDKKVNEFKEVKQRSKSKQKLQILKKNDICHGLDNYLNKQAKQMLYKSQNRPVISSPYSSRKKTTSNTYNIESPFQNNQLFQTGKNLQNLIENKFGKIKDNNNSAESRKINWNFISPVQTFKVE